MRRRFKVIVSKVHFWALWMALGRMSIALSRGFSVGLASIRTRELMGRLAVSSLGCMWGSGLEAAFLFAHFHPEGLRA
jgi:hypothetical protein